MATRQSRAERSIELEVPFHNSHHRVIRLTNYVRGARDEFLWTFPGPTLQGVFRDETGVTRARAPLTMEFRVRGNR